MSNDTIINTNRMDVKRYMTKMMDNLLAGAVGLFLKVVFPFCFPVKGFLIFTGCVVMCDTITGIIAAKKRGEKITSYGMRRTIEKLVAYFIAILLAEGFRVNFLNDIDVPYAVAFIIAVTEIKSNYENIESITNVSIWKVLKEKFFINNKNI